MTFISAYKAIQKLSAAGGEKPCPQLNEKQVLLSPENLLPAVAILQKNGIYHLSTITGVYDDEQLYLLYHFWEGEGVTLRIVIDEQLNEVETLTQLIPGALFYEREIAEMFAILIKGLDTSKKMYLPDNWEGGAPMRKVSPNPHGKAKAEES
jgi:NADH:ubiquinone oxidoreductase subunit C